MFKFNFVLGLVTSAAVAVGIASLDQSPDLDPIQNPAANLDPNPAANLDPSLLKKPESDLDPSPDLDPILGLVLEAR